jgi:hypothetical protein
VISCQAMEKKRVPGSLSPISEGLELNSGSHAQHDSLACTGEFRDLGRWLTCFCFVTFDLELGPVRALLQHVLCPRALSNRAWRAAIRRTGSPNPSLRTVLAVAAFVR